MKYTLTAELDSVTCTKTFHADNNEQAAFSAIAHILDEAHENKKSPWALGHIILSNSRGKVLQEMAAK